MNDSCQRLPKSDRLYGRDAVNEVFGKGEHSFIYPYKFYWRLFQNKQGALRFLVSVPKRNFKKAVDRNHIKRYTREAWRKNNQMLKNELFATNTCLEVGLVYVGKGLPELKEAEAKIILILQRLSVFHAHHQSNSVGHSHSDH